MDCQQIYLLGMERSAYRTVRGHFRNCEVCQVTEGRELLRILDRTRIGCVVGAFALPDGQITQLQQQLTNEEMLHPVLVSDRAPRVARALAVMESGGLDYLSHPVDPRRLMQRLAEGLDWHRRVIACCRRSRRLGRKLTLLTPRESQVCELMIGGRSIKRIAASLGTSPNTVRNQRASMLAKLGARNESDLVRRFCEAMLYRRLFQEPRLRWRAFPLHSPPESSHIPKLLCREREHEIAFSWEPASNCGSAMLDPDLASGFDE